MAGRDLQDGIRERMEKCSLCKEIPSFVMKEKLPCATSSVAYRMCLNSDVIVGLDVLFRLCPRPPRSTLCTTFKRNCRVKESFRNSCLIPRWF